MYEIREAELKAPRKERVRQKLARVSEHVLTTGRSSTRGLSGQRHSSRYCTPADHSLPIVFLALVAASLMGKRYMDSCLYRKPKAWAKPGSLATLAAKPRRGPAAAKSSLTASGPAAYDAVRMPCWLMAGQCLFSVQEHF